MALPLVSLCSPEVALSIFQHPRAPKIWNILFTWSFVMSEWQQFRTHLHSPGCRDAAEMLPRCCQVNCCLHVANWGQWRAAHILCELLSHFRVIWNWFRICLNYGRCRWRFHVRSKIQLMFACRQPFAKRRFEIPLLGDEVTAYYPGL